VVCCIRVHFIYLIPGTGLAGRIKLIISMRLVRPYKIKVKTLRMESKSGSLYFLVLSGVGRPSIFTT
jgi:hypothetical protein